jgi:hypothetical protein
MVTGEEPETELKQPELKFFSIRIPAIIPIFLLIDSGQPNPNPSQKTCQKAGLKLGG